ncbi:group 1 glycosyl transferase [Leptolyngbya boryana IAM M-101]|uniref:hypothetical protein n=1 Tax=Leptolyngbya boryana TaxID=1184 RepID=UPI0021F0E006|nr:hypothetical protein [Leptolyngbya boryana]BAS54448.1 group 1 glycosyl transferase [Leptolyngbya boryana IAM M-101]BAS60796.1 group 1 glycosyl transferase [Leptolyngbya boryana dg5]
MFARLRLAVLFHDQHFELLNALAPQIACCLIWRVMKVALVHDYLTQKGGAERVFEMLCKRYPDADIFTSLYEPEASIDFGDREVFTTYLQKIPQASRYFKLLAPLYYSAFRALDLREYDLIIQQHNQLCKRCQKAPRCKAHLFLS